MRDIKVSQVGTTWQLVNPSKGEIFLQGMEGALSYFITSTLLAPANNEAGLPLEVLAYRTASGHVWVKAVGTGRILSGLFESPGERVFFEGAYATLQQSFLSTSQTALPELVTALASVTEGDTTHPVAASVIFEMLTALSLEFQNISTALGDKAPLDSPSLTGDALAPTREPGDNSTHIATTAYADNAAGTAQTNAEGYADGLVVGLWDDRGTYDPTPGTWPTSADNGSGVDGAILKGDIWSISTAGTLTGGISVSVGDVIRALVDGPGNTATDWGVTENNLGYVAENSANKATVLSSPNDTDYPTTQAVVTGLGTREPALPADSLAGKFLREDRTFQAVIDVVLTGLSLASAAAVTAADSILGAIGKLQKQITDLTGSFRYSINAQTGTTYTVLSTDVNQYGNKILKLTNASAIAVTLPNPNALTPPASVGDSFNIRQGGAGGITLTGTVSGSNTTASINTTMTLIAESSTSWMSVGG